VDSRTDELLLSCLSGRAPGSRDSGPATADWSEVVARAVDFGLAPLLYKRLKEGGARAHVPADSWKLLRLHYFANAERITRLFRDIQPVLRCLRTEGIPVIVLKGAYLAEVVYAAAALRQMNDVDVMVPRAELPRAQAALLTSGCTQIEPVDIEAYRDDYCLPEFYLHDLPIELHWTIALPTGPVRIDVDGLWSRAHPATIAGVEVLALSPEDLLLHLCLHTRYLHQHFAPKPLCDIAEAVHLFRDDLDWAQVVARAHEWGAARHVGLALHLARVMLSVEVPDAVLEQLVPGGIDPRILETAKEFTLAQKECHQIVPLFDQLGAESLGDKARLVWKRVFLSRTEMTETYPASRNSRHLYRYYALRLRDVIRTYWSHAFRRGRLTAQSHGRDRNAALVNWLSAKGLGPHNASRSLQAARSEQNSETKDHAAK
jgi:hypothetical protein